MLVEDGSGTEVLSSTVRQVHGPGSLLGLLPSFLVGIGCFIPEYKGYLEAIPSEDFFSAPGFLLVQSTALMPSIRMCVAQIEWRSVSFTEAGWR